MDHNPRNWKPNLTPKTFTNPLTKTITIRFRDEANTTHTRDIAAFEVLTEPAYIADHFIKHIVDEIVLERESGYITPERRKELEREVTEI